MRSEVTMLKLLKAKVLGGTSTSTSPSFHIVSEKQPAKLQHIDDDTHNNNVFMPFEFDIIDIDSTSSSQQSSTETRQPPDTVDVHKSFSMSYRSSAAAKEYTLIKTVNVGSTAKVQLAYHEASRRHVALKIMKKSKQHIKYMNREVSIHKQLVHPNIVGLYDVIETPYHFVLAMEYLDGGDLFDLVPPNEGCPEPEALQYLQQIVAAVSHMHGRNVVHRDIKPENCVSDSHGNLKLIDFGAASAANGPSSPAGTIPYMAPEMFTVAPGATPDWNLKAMDIWALGVVYFTLLTGRFPWAVANGDKSPEFSEYLDGSLTSRYPWQKITTRSLVLLKRMLCVDANKRATVDEVLDIVSAMREAEARVATAQPHQSAFMHNSQSADDFAQFDDIHHTVPHTPEATLTRAASESAHVPVAYRGPSALKAA